MISDKCPNCNIELKARVLGISIDIPNNVPADRIKDYIDHEHERLFKQNIPHHKLVVCPNCTYCENR